MTYRKRPIRRHLDPYGHLIIEGGTYMGPQRIPPLPNRVALTDRTTGDVRVLSHTGDPGFMTISLVQINSTWTDVTKYAAGEEPWVVGVDGATYRLFLDNGALNVATSGTAGASQLILTRNGFDTHVLQVSANGPGSVLYTEYDI